MTVSFQTVLRTIAIHEGKTKSNILLDLDSGGLCQHPSIIVHPDAAPDWLYEMYLLRYPEKEGPQSIVRGFPLPEGKPASTSGVYRYHSADGKRWQAWEKLSLEPGDSILVHQLADGTYRSYYKGILPVPPGGLVPYDIAVGECRIIVIRTSEDGSNWSGPVAGSRKGTSASAYQPGPSGGWVVPFLSGLPCSTCA
jgi:hypothetical protein